MMTLEEAIKHCEEVADICEYEASRYDMTDAYESHMAYQQGLCAERHRQLAEWLRELKIHREIHDVLLQFMADSDLDICCDDLMDDAEEQKICEENCDNKCLNCWVRWARLKAREVNDADSD